MAQATKFRMIQLWTNGGGKEFALKLEDAEQGIFAAATHLGTDYPFMVEQFSCTEDAGCDWEAILQKHADKWTQGDAIRALIQTKELESNDHIKDLHNNIRR